ncbi:MAG: ligand-gated TonB-dependent outer rane channel [Proteobacteria bacterium]|nr:ligand-gated TonB-dependent outer rane channel [Pseudomonadota bacterium]
MRDGLLVKPLCLFLEVFLVLGQSVAMAASAHSSGAAELVDLPLEQLLDMEVSSVSKQARHVSDSPAAVFVLTQEDIRRSGAASIPEALRMVPGLQVSRVDRNKWAISARGFNDTVANKLLVLMDGRSVYTPVFSGVWWDTVDTMLEDIERIEVIRGPGASLWGANAVNGVINIITKSAKDTQGALLSTSMGTIDNGAVSLRYGGRLGEATDYRVYGKYFDRDAYKDQERRDAGDDWRSGRGGFRLDSRLTPNDSLTVQGDLFRGDNGGAPIADYSLSPPYVREVPGDNRVNGANLLSRWTRRLDDDSSLALQLYYDRNERHSPAVGARFVVDIADLDFQHEFNIGDRNRIVWGAGYRFLHHHTTNTFTTSLIPDERSDHLFSVFLQDEIKLIPDRLRLTLGSKLEHRNAVGFQVQPTGRLLWTPDRKNSLWTSVSRAVRMPSWVEQDLLYNFQVMPPNPPDSTQPTVLSLVGNHQFHSESVLAYELGYRSEIDKSLSLDLALYYNDYHSLESIEPLSCQANPGLAYVDCPSTFGNKLEGNTYGAELSVLWSPLDYWRLQGGYTYQHMNLRAKPGSGYRGADADEGNNPQQQFFLRSSLDLPSRTRFDLGLRYVGETPTQNLGDYFTLDAQLSWKPVRELELSLIGRNLSSEYHREWTRSFALTPTYVERDFLATVRWAF